MKLVIISPPFGEDILENKTVSTLDEMRKSQGLPIAPPVLEYLAGLTLKYHSDVEIELIDANMEDFKPDDINPKNAFGFYFSGQTQDLSQRQGKAGALWARTKQTHTH